MAKNKEEFIIGFRVVKNRWWNKIFPFTNWECVVKSEEDVMQMEMKIRKQIDKLITKEELK